ncbi:acyltransferase [Streptomyces globosus]|uniref:acyltransferase n=1 Tax=Streptomyces globosus TaxID=68209 RepID=UPI00381167B2
MLRLHKLERYKDDQGNQIVYDGETRENNIDIRFEGSNNTLTVSPEAYVRDLSVAFWGDNGQIEIGPTTTKWLGLRFELRCGHESSIWIGENVDCAGPIFVSAAEGVSVTIGNETILGENLEVRGDDTHPIYDVRTGKRVNPSQSIVVGEHVWIAKHTVVMGGVSIGNGSVIGLGSIVTSSIPNNCVAVGSPARVVRRDVAWERPWVLPRQPNEQYPRVGEKTERYWNLTDDAAIPETVAVRPRAEE